MAATAHPLARLFWNTLWAAATSGVSSLPWELNATLLTEVRSQMHVACKVAGPTHQQQRNANPAVMVQVHSRLQGECVQHGNEKLSDAAAYQAWGCEQKACGVLQRGKCGGALEDLSFDLAHGTAHPKAEAPMTCKYKQVVKLNQRTAEDMNC